MWLVQLIYLAMTIIALVTGEKELACLSLTFGYLATIEDKIDRIERKMK